MIRDFVETYYLEGDYNCAETLLLAANDAYALGLPEGAHRLVSAFGAGMGCERACGAVCGAPAVRFAARLRRLVACARMEGRMPQRALRSSPQAL